MKSTALDRVLPSLLQQPPSIPIRTKVKSLVVSWPVESCGHERSMRQRKHSSRNCSLRIQKNGSVLVRTDHAKWKINRSSRRSDGKMCSLDDCPCLSFLMSSIQVTPPVSTSTKKIGEQHRLHRIKNWSYLLISDECDVYFLSIMLRTLQFGIFLSFHVYYTRPRWTKNDFHQY